MKLTLIATIALLSFVAIADSKETYRDRTGKVVMTATTAGNKTTFRDKMGRKIGEKEIKTKNKGEKNDTARKTGK